MGDEAFFLNNALARFSDPAEFCRSLIAEYLAMDEEARVALAAVLIAEIAAREVMARHRPVTSSTSEDAA
ncbi:hypothetical protein [Paracoccus sp. (in: a-proteobacteria)]|uniref:hypothetical protein n=1 Tax=Paracoccus sp. TaxID=267 RepID=UPI00258BFC21|nr:hypothetical protein [Paracoccus sp. (in: a-proteobacteria)]